MCFSLITDSRRIVLSGYGFAIDIGPDAESPEVETSGLVKPRINLRAGPWRKAAVLLVEG
jgi:hypothetical protein